MNLTKRQRRLIETMDNHGTLFLFTEKNCELFDHRGDRTLVPWFAVVAPLLKAGILVYGPNDTYILSGV